MSIFKGKAKLHIVFILVLAMMLQLAVPVVSSFVYAEGVTEDTINETNPSDDDGQNGEEATAPGDENDGTGEDANTGDGETNPPGESGTAEDGENGEPEIGPSPVIPEVISDVSAMADGVEEDSFYDIVPENSNEITYKLDIRYQDKAFGYHEINDGDEVDLSEVQNIEYVVKFAIGNDVKFTETNTTKTFNLKALNLGGLNLENTSGIIEFRMKNNDTNVIETVNGGSYKIEKNILTIELKPDELEDYKERKAYVQLNYEVEMTTEELPLIEEVELDGMEDKTFFIKRKNTKAKLVSKSGNYDKNKDLIHWDIDVNTALSSLNNARLEDTMPAGLTVTKVEIIDLEVTTNDIKIAEEEVWHEIEFNEPPNSYKGNKLTLDLSDKDFIRKAKRIKITTTIDSDKTGDQNFPNEVELYGNGKDDKLDYDSENVQINNRVAGISKSNAWDGSTNTITWTIEFRGDGKAHDLIDEFTLPTGVKLVLEDDIKLDGSEFKGEIDKSKIADGKITFKGVVGKTEGTSKLTFKTKVIFENRNEAETEYTIDNKATYNGLEAKSSITKSRGEVMTKGKGTIYGEKGKTYIKWDITINKKNEKWKDVTIIERLPAEFEFVSANIGDAAIADNKIVNPGSEGNIEISIGEIDKATTVTIVAKLKEGKTIPETLVNKATIKYKYNYIGGGIGGSINDEEYSEEVEGSNTKTEFNNTLSKSGKINYNDSTVTWTVKYKTLNDNVNGLVFEDTLSGEHYIGADKFNLKLNREDVNFVSITNESEENTTQSTILLNADNKSFRIKLANNLGNHEFNEIELTYKTRFDLTKMEDKDNVVLLNNKIKSNGTEQEVTASVSIEKWISKNGRKSVKPLGDGMYEWKVQLNPKSKTIPMGTEIMDVLTADKGSYQKYVKDSITIVKAELKDVDKNNLSPTIDIIKFNSELDTKTTTVNSREITYDEGMTITLGEEVKAPFIITYQTKAVGLKSTEYKNEVKINIDGYLPHTASTKSNITIDDYITKELLNGRPISGGNGVVKGDILEWKIVVNKVLSEIYDFELIDTMEDGLIFIKDSFKVNGESYDKEGFNLGDLTGNEGFKLTKDLVDNQLVITYETLVYSENTELANITNNVNLSGFELVEKKIENNTFRIIPRSEAGGVGITGSNKEYYNLNIQKKAIENGELTNLPAVVEFELITVTTIGDNAPLSSSEKLFSDSNGRLEIKGLQKTKEDDYVKIQYFLKEIKAPEGYIVLDKEIEIILNAEGDSKTIELPIVNIEKTSISGTKKWLDDGPKDRPTEIIVNLMADGAIKGSKIVTNNNWSYEFTDLPKYKLNKDGEYKDIKYTVEEETVRGYNPSYEKTENGYDITNLREGKFIITGKKEWINGPKDKPTIEFQLYRNGEKFGDLVTLENGTTKYYWTDLDEFDESGRKYNYTVKEVNVPENYTKVEEGLTVTNTYVIPKTQVTGTKEWKGGSSKKPTIELQLYQDGVAHGGTVTLVDGNTSHTWTQLDKTDINGKEHVYTIDEVEVPRGYRKSISDDGLTVINTIIPDPSDPEGRIRIIKKDSDTKELLSGAKFDIIDSKGKVVDTLTTNSRGEATSKYLPTGRYTIEETKAPKGYILDVEVIEERVTDGETIEVVVYNDKEDPDKPIEPEKPVDPDKPVDPNEPGGEDDEFENVDDKTPQDTTKGDKPTLPKTGTTNTLGYVLLGLVTIFLGLVLRKKELNN